MRTNTILPLTFSILLFAGNVANGEESKAPEKSPTSEKPPANSKKDTETVRHPFVAKLLLKKLEPVDMTPEQMSAFNRLSADLRAKIDKNRAAVGITKETIKKRDEVYSKLKKTDLEGDALWNKVQE